MEEPWKMSVPQLDQLPYRAHLTGPSCNGALSVSHTMHPPVTYNGMNMQQAHADSHTSCRANPMVLEEFNFQAQIPVVNSAYTALGTGEMLPFAASNLQQHMVGQPSRPPTQADAIAMMSAPLDSSCVTLCGGRSHNMGSSWMPHSATSHQQSAVAQLDEIDETMRYIPSEGNNGSRQSSYNTWSDQMRSNAGTSEKLCQPPALTHAQPQMEDNDSVIQIPPGRFLAGAPLRKNNSVSTVMIPSMLPDSVQRKHQPANTYASSFSQNQILMPSQNMMPCYNHVADLHTSQGTMSVQNCQKSWGAPHDASRGGQNSWMPPSSTLLSSAANSNLASAATPMCSGHGVDTVSAQDYGMWDGSAVGTQGHMSVDSTYGISGRNINMQPLYQDSAAGHARGIDARMLPQQLQHRQPQAASSLSLTNSQNHLPQTSADQTRLGSTAELLTQQHGGIRSKEAAANLLKQHMHQPSTGGIQQGGAANDANSLFAGSTQLRANTNMQIDQFQNCVPSAQRDSVKSRSMNGMCIPAPHNAPCDQFAAASATTVWQGLPDRTWEAKEGKQRPRRDGVRAKGRLQPDDPRDSMLRVREQMLVCNEQGRYAPNAVMPAMTSCVDIAGHLSCGRGGGNTKAAAPLRRDIASIIEGMGGFKPTQTSPNTLNAESIVSGSPHFSLQGQHSKDVPAARKKQEVDTSLMDTRLMFPSNVQGDQETPAFGSHKLSVGVIGAGLRRAQQSGKRKVSSNGKRGCGLGQASAESSRRSSTHHVRCRQNSDGPRKFATSGGSVASSASTEEVKLAVGGTRASDMEGNKKPRRNDTADSRDAPSLDFMRAIKGAARVACTNTLSASMVRAPKVERAALRPQRWCGLATEFSKASKEDKKDPKGLPASVDGRPLVLTQACMIVILYDSSRDVSPVCVCVCMRACGHQVAYIYMHILLAQKHITHHAAPTI